MSHPDTTEDASESAEELCIKCGQSMPDLCDACGQELLQSEEDDSDASVIELNIRKCDGYEFELQRDGTRRAVCKACNRTTSQCPNCEDFYTDDEKEEEVSNFKVKRRKGKRRVSTESEESQESEETEQTDESEKTDGSDNSDESDGNEDSNGKQSGHR